MSEGRHVRIGCIYLDFLKHIALCHFLETKFKIGCIRVFCPQYGEPVRFQNIDFPEKFATRNVLSKISCFKLNNPCKQWQVKVWLVKSLAGTTKFPQISHLRNFLHSALFCDFSTHPFQCRWSHNWNKFANQLIARMFVRPEKTWITHIRIGGICFAFLQCMLSNVHSKQLHRR